MTCFFLDASALAKRYVRESGTDAMNMLFANAYPDRLFLLSLAIAEVVHVLVRKRNRGDLPANLFEQAMLDVGAEILQAPAVNKIEAATREISDAIPLIAAHAINATDSLVLRAGNRSHPENTVKTDTFRSLEARTDVRCGNRKHHRANLFTTTARNRRSNRY